VFECRMCGDVFDIYDEAERHVIEEHAEELFVEDEELRRFILGGARSRRSSCVSGASS